MSGSANNSFISCSCSKCELVLNKRRARFSVLCDDEDLIREVCKKVLEAYEARDAYEGEERDAFIDDALKDYKSSYAAVAAAE